MKLITIATPSMFRRFSSAIACYCTSAVNRGQRVSKTSSRCLTESFSATHDFEVTNYPLLNGMGVGKYVSSGNFNVGGYDFAIRFYPDGFNEVDSVGYASAYLYCVSQLSQVRDVRAKFSFIVLEKEGKVPISTFKVQERAFSAANFDWGFMKFIEKSKLKSSSGISSDYLTIRCHLTVIEKPHTVVKRRDLVFASQPNLTDHLQQMWKGGQGADVTFIVRDQSFKAHRCLLAARSPVFRTELSGPTNQKGTQCINIEDIEPPIFEGLLHFVYTDFLPDDNKHHKEGKTAKVQQLLVAADRYRLDRLKVLCERKLCDSIDVQTVATTLVLAEKHGCKDVLQACVEFMAPPKVLRAVMSTDGFKDLVATCPSVMKDILDKVSHGDWLRGHI